MRRGATRRGATNGGAADGAAINGGAFSDTGDPWLGSALKAALRTFDPVPEEVVQAAKSAFAARHRAAPIVAELIASSRGTTEIALLEDGRPVRMHVFRVPGRTIRLFVADGRRRRVAGQIDPAGAAEARVYSGTSDTTPLVAQDGKFAVDELDTGPLVVTLLLEPAPDMRSTTAQRVVLNAPDD